MYSLTFEIFISEKIFSPWCVIINNCIIYKKLVCNFCSQLRLKISQSYLYYISCCWQSISIFYAKGRTWRDVEKNLHASCCACHWHLAASSRSKLSKSHRIDIRRAFASANCATLVEPHMIDGLVSIYIYATAVDTCKKEYVTFLITFNSQLEVFL